MPGRPIGDCTMQAFIGGGKMRAFEVYVNGRYLLTAGVRDGVLSGGITWAGRSSPHLTSGNYILHVGGIDGDIDEHVNWSVPELGLGDEITIKLIESDQISPADRRDPVDRTSPDEPPIQMATSD